jgi:hypothetical protein
MSATGDRKVGQAMPPDSITGGTLGDDGVIKSTFAAAGNTGCRTGR